MIFSPLNNEMNVLNNNHSAGLSHTNGKPFVAKISLQLSDETWLIDNLKQATRAFSCLVKPINNDKVLCVNIENQLYITAILERDVNNTCDASPNHHVLGVPNSENIQIQANNVNVVAQQKLTLASVGNIEITAKLGKLVVSVKNMLQSIQHSFIHMSSQIISKTEHHNITASKLMKTHARHQILTADKEMKIDAKRINMG